MDEGSHGGELQQEEQYHMGMNDNSTKYDTAGDLHLELAPSAPPPGQYQS